MTKHIAIIQGHPDTCPDRLVRALAASYAKGAHTAGHTVRIVDMVAMTFPVLRTKHDFDDGVVADDIRRAQESIRWAERWAEHLVIFYPLWLGTMSALLHAFFEQTFRPGFASISPVKESLYGLVEARSDITHGKSVAQLRELGRAGK